MPIAPGRAAVSLASSAVAGLFAGPLAGAMSDGALVAALAVLAGGTAAAVGRTAAVPTQPQAEPAAPSAAPPSAAPGPTFQAAPAASPPAESPVPAGTVALEWSAPAASQAHVPQDYTLTARNLSPSAAQHVVVQVRPCAASVVQSTSPPARVVNGVQLFELGTLAGLESRAMTLRLLASTAGAGSSIECQAWVTSTGAMATKFAVRQAQLGITLDAPGTVAAGESAVVRVTVTNSGDAPAERAGVQLLRSSVPAGEPRVLPTLAAGASATFDYPVTFAESGTQFWVAYATLPPPGSADAAGVARVCEASATTAVVCPVLKLTLDGPKELMVGRAGEFTLRVENAGTAAAEGLGFDCPVPSGWRVTEGAAPGDLAPADLPPGQSRSVSFRAAPTALDAAPWSAGAGSGNCAVPRAECRTTVFGVAALRMELLDTIDPVEVGGETVYEVRLMNTGSRADAAVTLACPVPEQLELVAADGPTPHTSEVVNGRTVVRFAPLGELAPGAAVLFRVRVRALAAGDARFQAQLTSESLGTPVVKEESTRVY